MTTNRIEGISIPDCYDGIRHRPASTFGNVKADVLADKGRLSGALNFCSVISRIRLASLNQSLAYGVAN